MSGKKEQKSSRVRKSNKMVDMHRRFLDMDTDEEEMGRQESPEVEEELPPEPEKPVFSEEDLITLVRYVQNLTILSPFENADWNEKCDEVIREYFENPSHVLLIIFYDGNKLCATLGPPEWAPRGFTYFSRSTWQIYTPDNFFNTVSFGTISGNVKNSVLKYMENLYAPALLRSDNYASFIKSDVLTNLHDFLVSLKEDVYKPMNLTSLYVPRERFPKALLEPSNRIDYFLLGESKNTVVSDEDEGKRKLVDRLEKVAWSWIRQIYEAVEPSKIRGKIKSIRGELNYWKMKHFNLNYLHIQVLNADVRLIVNVLRNLHSPSVNKFEELVILIEIRLKEASSNLTYLNVLFDFCKDLNIPEDSENSLTDVLLLILFIWTESPFYHTTDNIATLCQALSAQIIRQCKRYIKLDVVFEKSPENGIKMLEKCISCCDIYEAIYDSLTDNVAPRINRENKWDVNRGEIFEDIDTFKQRCYDVIEICRAIIVFGRCNKVGSFGSPKGTQYEACCRKIENMFYESLNGIVISSDVIFNVTNPNWLEKIRRFKCTVSQLENMVINLINDVFRDVRNIEEGIEMIYTLQQFKKRDNLEELLIEKWKQVWQIFSNEIEDCYMNAIEEFKKYKKSKRGSNTDINILCISNYLKNQYTIMLNAMDWIGECGAEECTLQQYKRVSDLIDERRKMFNTYSTYATQ